MKLPVKQILSKNRKHYQIVDNEQKVIIPNIPQIEDAMQVEKYLNNYTKVLQFLQWIKESDTWNKGLYSTDINLANELEEYLKLLKDEKTIS